MDISKTFSESEKDIEARFNRLKANNPGVYAAYHLVRSGAITELLALKCLIVDLIESNNKLFNIALKNIGNKPEEVVAIAKAFRDVDNSSKK